MQWTLLELTFAIFKDSLKHACIDSNDFFQIVVKACLQLENNDTQADITVVREPVWAYLRQHVVILLPHHLTMLYLVTYLH